MPRRSLLSLAIFFLFSVSAGAPIAFFAGKARGASGSQLARAGFHDLFEFETGGGVTTETAGGASGQSGDLCDVLKRLERSRQTLYEIFCVAFSSDRDWINTAPLAGMPPANSQPSLQTALIGTIAGANSSVPGSSSPVSLALAPDGGIGLKITGAPALPPASRIPQILPPGIFPGGKAVTNLPVIGPPVKMPTPTAPPGNIPLPNPSAAAAPPPVVTPLPGAAWLLLTGLAGLVTAKRNRKSKPAR